MKILLATQNKHKIQEITEILASFPSIIIDIPTQNLDIVEGEVSYIENALLKAKSWAKLYPQHYILADDSGLEVPSIDNAPGVISAEYAGKNASHQEHIDKLLRALNGIQQRQAVFISYILLLSPKGEIFFSRGECHGQIALESQGTEGFGYDPVFLPLEFNYQYSMAQLSSTQKNTISHRNKALIGLKDYIAYIKEDTHD